ncbi:hypothetical protein [uncultured Roseobacter sp.]|uniref:hypothetical protein n=1 Tax=uncultured Roseobacter sp. TaxID=114847 RepID=UPI002631992F|nr:hypothetical protein [uncultured Roseobacter sp.]
MPRLWLFDIEPHEQRYTGEWQKTLPQQLHAAMYLKGQKAWSLEVVSGHQTSGKTSIGGFLDFAETNAYKAAQVSEFVAMVQSGTVRDSDRVLFADAWHPGVIQCRYIADLLDIDLSIDVMWHAGSYDPWDQLGQKVSNKAWSYAFEKAVFQASDTNYFATKFHWEMFHDALRPDQPERAKTVGWPMEYLCPLLEPLAGSTEKDTILFPHRLASEKMPKALEILRDHLPQYRIVFAQEQALTKQQYHQELARALVVFSASLQETLGIGTFEGLLAGAVPIVPNRLSYTEIYGDRAYPSEWSANEQAVADHARQLAQFIEAAIQSRDPSTLEELAVSVGDEFFNGRELYRHVLR